MEEASTGKDKENVRDGMLLQKADTEMEPFLNPGPSSFARTLSTAPPCQVLPFTPCILAFTGAWPSHELTGGPA
jgi:hypothetical protein